MKRYVFRLIAAAFILLTIMVRGADAKILTVPSVSQLPQTNWCWAASSQAVLSYTQNAPGMCNIADWARQQNGWGNDNCCTNGTGAICNQPNAMWGPAGSLQSILQNWGAESDNFSRSLNLSEVQEAIDDDGPIVVRWGWTAGGGHFVVLHGYTGSNMTVMDPWSGPTTMTHSNLTSTSTRAWTHTLVVKPKKITYVVDDTGSMWNEIASVKTTLNNQVNGYRNAGTFVKYTLITYKDYVNFRGSTVNHNTISSWISSLSASGGGDCPEEGYGALDTAAERAANSDVWWMTDADSHGNFLRMLQTRFRLLLAGCTLHSVVMGSCSSSFLMAAESLDGSATSQNEIGVEPAGLGTAAESVTLESNVNAFTSGEELSGGTGGLFFSVGSASVDEATEIILNEINSSALIKRLNLPAGEHTTLLPVDESIEELKIILNVKATATGNLTVTAPDATILTLGLEGVSEIVAGNSHLLIVTPPALMPGIYTITSSSNHDYLLSISSISEQAIILFSETTGGVGYALAVKVAIPSLVLPTGIAGPGDEGPGGALDLVTFDEPILPFNPSDLTFFVEKKDGSNRLTIMLYDDGFHDDGIANDGVFGGTVVLNIEGNYRFGVTDGKRFERVTQLTILANVVSLTASDDKVAAPGSSVSHTFTVQNISSVARTFNLAIDSSAGWANLTSVPSSITIGADASVDVVIITNVPSVAVNGDSSILSLTVVAEDDPSVFDSASVKTLAWIGPLLQSLSTTSVFEDEELTFYGSGLGTDPGHGNRSTDINNVTIAGQRIPETHVLAWADGSIVIRVPNGASSGLVYVVAGGEQSNELEVVINKVPSISVAFDIKPGSCPNPLNLNSKGVLALAVLGTDEFDVYNIDPATVMLTMNGNGDDSVAPLRWAYEDAATPFKGELCDCHDHNGDGYIDLTLKFETQEIVNTLGLSSYVGETIPLSLTGNLKEDYGGTPIYGQDCVWIIEK